MQHLLSTKEVAEYLNIHEKKVYSLIAEKALPATKIAGKWLFPLYLVEQWVENNTINIPSNSRPLTSNQRLIILAGSNDTLLEHTITLFNRSFKSHLIAFANIGSMGGIQALRNNFCHIASSHLMQDDEIDYNFQFARAEFEKMPVVVNLCKRVQGLIVQKGNPLNIESIADFNRPGLRMVNRSLATGTRLLLDKELNKKGIYGDKIKGYRHEVARHIDVGIEILANRADVGMGIEIVAHTLGLDFIPIRWERFDLLVSKEIFFNQSIQNFFGILQSTQFKDTGKALAGYDLSQTGRIMFQEKEPV